ncbi:MAG: tripartite tricarboxylate transporter TctB family protein [Deltaproteobacteria bacterium]|nr:tripartite tricarboxylate transporter TctB family protein [Deltaproteobacteria bacterium]
MRIKNKRDFLAGLMFTATGIVFALIGTQYKFGSAAQMGAGYFPIVVSVVMSLLGIVISLHALTPKAEEEQVPAFYWKKLFLVLGPIVLFSVVLKWLGLILSLLLLIGLSSTASHEFGWKGTLVNAAILIVFCLVVFVWILNIYLPLWPWFMDN